MAEYTQSKAVMLPDGRRLSLLFEMNWLVKGDNLVIFYEKKKVAVFYHIKYDKKLNGLKCEKRMCWSVRDEVPLFIRNSDFLEVLTKDNIMLRSVYEYGNIKRYKQAGQKEHISDKQYILYDYFYEEEDEEQQEEQQEEEGSLDDIM